jgi:mRNA interferase MazF
MVVYIPDRGDIVWLQFNLQSGHEQAGKRPALTLSPKEYNQKTGLAIFCPVTSHEKGYPFEVKVEDRKISGVILADQVKSLDWRKREAEFIGKAPSMVINEAIELLKTLIS